MQTANTNYDPRLHITAREIRAEGIPLEKEIPDYCYIKRESIVVGNLRNIDNEVIYTISFNEKFLWIEGTINVQH